MEFWRSRCSGLALEDNIILTHGYHSKASGIVDVIMVDLMWLCPDTAVLGVNCGLSIRFGHMSLRTCLEGGTYLGCWRNDVVHKK